MDPLTYRHSSRQSRTPPIPFTLGICRMVRMVGACTVKGQGEAFLDILYYDILLYYDIILCVIISVYVIYICYTVYHCILRTLGMRAPLGFSSASARLQLESDHDGSFLCTAGI